MANCNDKHGHILQRGDKIKIVAGDDARGDVVEIREMREMANNGEYYTVEECNSEHVRANGWWFEPIYVIKYEELPGPFHITGVKPTLFDVNVLTT